MRREASIWRWYASVNDSTRNQLIDQGWFNRPSNDQSMTRDVDAMAERDIHGNVQGDAWASVYGRNAHAQPFEDQPGRRVEADSAVHAQMEQDRDAGQEIG